MIKWLTISDVGYMFSEDVDSVGNKIMVFQHPDGVLRRITLIEVEVWNGENKSTNEASCTISYPKDFRLTD